MNRAEILRARRKRKRILLGTLFSLALGLLVAAGVAVGAAIGVAAEKVPELARILRENPTVTKVLPVKEPPLEANKKAPPKPMDDSGPAVACSASSLTLTLNPEFTERGPAEGMWIHVTVAHTGRVPCLVNGGMENLRLRLVNDKGEVGWSSADCGWAGMRKLLMGPGYDFTWDAPWEGRASAPGVCDTGQPLAPGTWQLVASLGEVAYSDSAHTAVIVRAPVVQAIEPAPMAEPASLPESTPLTEISPTQDSTPESTPERQPSETPPTEAPEAASNPTG